MATNEFILGAVAELPRMKLSTVLKPKMDFGRADSAHRFIACRVLSCEEDTMKTLIYVIAVLLPALIVGISNFAVFPDSWLLATIMLAVTAAASAVFTWKSGDATPKISRYCILADIAIGVILCFNLGGHWILAREVSAAKQGVEERHTEEDREDKRRAAADDRQLKLIEAERRRLRALPREERRSILSAPKSEPTAAIVAGQGTVARLTPDEVRAKWWWYLTGLAIAECAVSVLGGLVLSGIWEWDRNHDGIADHLQVAQPVAALTPAEHSCPATQAVERAKADNPKWPDEVGK